MMDAHPDSSGLRDAFASLAAGARPSKSCPAPEALWALARAEAAPGSARDLVDHTASCAACAEAFRIARDLASDVLPPRAAQEHEARVRPWWRIPDARWALTAAAMVVIAGLALVFRPGPPASSAPAFRDAEQRVLGALVPDGVVLPRERCVLRWTPGPTGSRYSVVVTTEDLVPVVRTRGLPEAQYEIPAGALAGFPSGAMMVWRVEALLPAGGRLRSDASTFRLE